MPSAAHHPGTTPPSRANSAAPKWPTGFRDSLFERQSDVVDHVRGGDQKAPQILAVRHPLTPGLEKRFDAILPQFLEGIAQRVAERVVVACAARRLPVRDDRR